MADSTTFDFVCSELERRTALNRLEVRGTVRIALKAAGLDGAITPEQMKVVLDRVLPAELRERGVGEPEAHCAAVAAGLSGERPGEDSAETPEAIFARLARG